ncbi:MAG: RidA family protein [Nitrospirota bacterium]
MSAEEKLRELGIELPAAPPPLGSYVPFARTESLVFLSGILPLQEGRLTKQGRVGQDVTLHEAAECAKVATVNALSILKANLGSLNNVRRCVKITGYVASTPDFTDQPRVLNAASDLIFEVFGEAGRHARSAVGVSVLPFNSPVEIEFIFEVS